MPIPSQVANAAVSFKQNEGLLEKCCRDLSAEEWLKAPSDDTNHILWIAGHIVWARAAVIRFLGAPDWSRPWLGTFARGKKLEAASQYPGPEDVMSAMADVSAQVRQALANASEDVVTAPAPPNSPPSDGTKAGIINFLAYHETYHVGQIAYLHSWLGHAGPQG